MLSQAIIQAALALNDTDTIFDPTLMLVNTKPANLVVNTDFFYTS